MPDTDNRSSFRQIFEEGKKYLTLQFDYVKLTATEKISLIGSMTLVLILALIFMTGAMFYLSFALVYLMEPYIGLMWSYAVLAGIALLCAVVVIVFRTPLIINPITRFLTKVLLSDNDKEDSASSDSREEDLNVEQ
jgi:hypothetical protein